MVGVIKLGQVLNGKLSIYTITKEIHNGIWLAKYLTSLFSLPSFLLHSSVLTLRVETKLIKQLSSNAPETNGAFEMSEIY